MIDHLSIHVSDWDKSKEFYSKALAPLGYAQTIEMEEWKVTGYGVGGKSDTWIIADGADKPGHVAYRASHQAAKITARQAIERTILLDTMRHLSLTLTDITSKLSSSILLVLLSDHC
jgi:catechol 2,3-dioxygenase-like lactoylglutathione lyase family enzyme